MNENRCRFKYYVLRTFFNMDISYKKCLHIREKSIDDLGIDDLAAR